MQARWKPTTCDRLEACHGDGYEVHVHRFGRTGRSPTCPTYCDSRLACDSGLRLGNAATQLLELAGELRGEPFDLHLVANRISDSLSVRLARAGVAVHLVGDSRVFGGLPLPRTLSLLRAIEPQVIHGWRVEQSWPVLLAVRLIVAGTAGRRLSPAYSGRRLAFRAGRRDLSPMRHARVRHCPWWGPMSERVIAPPGYPIGRTTRATVL